MNFFTAIEVSEEMNFGVALQVIASFLKNTPNHTRIITTGDIYTSFLLLLSSKQFQIVYLEDEPLYNQNPEQCFTTALQKHNLPTFSLMLNKIHHPQCERIIVCTAQTEFPLPTVIQYQYITVLDAVRTSEHKYLQLLTDVLRDGEMREDRTGVGTRSLFGIKLEFDLAEGFPLLTTKTVPFRHILTELFWFLSGSMDTSFLEEHGVTIWRGNTSREFLDKRGLHLYETGDVGPLYGYQWRHFGESPTQKGVDQIARLIHLLKTEPTSRRMVMSAWNPVDLDKMVLEPCHVSFQLYVREGKWLDGMLYMRSNDLFLGAPWNIACYALLLHMFAHLADYQPGKLVYTVGDAHIYEDHIEQVKEQCKRAVRRFPKLRISNTKKQTIDDFSMEEFELMDYHPHPRLKGKMAV